LPKNSHQVLSLVFVFVLWLMLGCSTDNPSEGETLNENIRLGIIPDNLELNSLILLAERKGYFRKNSVNVIFIEQTSGVESLNNIENGNLDLGLATEYVFAKKIGKSTDITIISTVAEGGEQVAILLNSGSANNSDRPALKGRSIGVVKGSGAEYFLDRFLTYQGAVQDTVSVRGFSSPREAYDAFVSGETDAMIIWQPYIWKAQTELGSKVLTFPAQSGQPVFWNLYGRTAFVNQHPRLINSFMKSLVEAETFRQKDQEEAKALVYKESSHSYEYFDSIYRSTQPGVALDHSLLIALESELRWILEKKSPEPIQLPNLLPHFSFWVLDEVKPNEVNIIHKKNVQ
jgi:ABC-type nitrate/sulfonate/bicarbonate transport system substrate-binding protein